VVVVVYNPEEDNWIFSPTSTSDRKAGGLQQKAARTPKGGREGALLSLGRVGGGPPVVFHPSRPSEPRSPQ